MELFTIYNKLENNDLQIVSQHDTRKETLQALGITSFNYANKYARNIMHETDKIVVYRDYITEKELIA